MLLGMDARLRMPARRVVLGGEEEKFVLTGRGASWSVPLAADACPDWLVMDARLGALERLRW